MLRNFTAWLGGFGIVAVVLFWLAFIVGYGLNIIDFFQALGGEVSVLFLARILGIIVPFVGAVLGWFF